MNNEVQPPDAVDFACCAAAALLETQGEGQQQVESNGIEDAKDAQKAVGSLTEGACSAPAARRGPSAASVVRRDTVISFSFTFLIPLTGWGFSNYGRHPLALDQGWWQVGAQIKDSSLSVWYRRKPSSARKRANNRESGGGALENQTKPAFICFVSMDVYCKETGRTLQRHVPIFEYEEEGSDWRHVVDRKLRGSPLEGAGPSVVLSVSITLLNDREVLAALDELSAPAPPPLPAPEVPLILRRLWESGVNADLTVEAADGSETRAHACFLMASSPVFESMFSHDLLERSSGRLALRDASPDAVREMLRFLYLQTVATRDEDVLLELVGLAHRYDLQQLLSACEEALVELIRAAEDARLAAAALPVAQLLGLARLKRFSEMALLSNLSANSFVKYLQLAADHGAELLKRYAAGCVVVLRLALGPDKDWNRFQETHPDFAEAVYRECLRFNFCVSAEAEPEKR